MKDIMPSVPNRDDYVRLEEGSEERRIQTTFSRRSNETFSNVGFYRTELCRDFLNAVGALIVLVGFVLFVAGTLRSVKSDHESDMVVIGLFLQVFGFFMPINVHGEESCNWVPIAAGVCLANVGITAIAILVVNNVI